jgi:hypothetical protein
MTTPKPARSPAIAATLGILGALGACQADGHKLQDAAARDGGAGAPDASPGADAGRPVLDAGHDASATKHTPDASRHQGHDGGVIDAGSPDAGGPRWTLDIYPRLVDSCGNCHGLAGSGDDAGGPRPGLPGLPGVEGGSDAPGKFAVDDAAAAYAAVRPYLSPGAPEQSILYIKISEDAPTTGGQRMPPALRQWDDESIAAVHDWIAAGAPQN